MQVGRQWRGKEMKDKEGRGKTVGGFEREGETVKEQGKDERNTGREED